MLARPLPSNRAWPRTCTPAWGYLKYNVTLVPADTREPVQTTVVFLPCVTVAGRWHDAAAATMNLRDPDAEPWAASTAAVSMLVMCPRRAIWTKPYGTVVVPVTV